ncbi:murein endopeptidase [Rhodovulum bhavnagarense]|uniref:Murein endopeptidase n=1 Tax=Rhodovulum bhavnagarense TaxID=992286 RepID=A0A4R2R909_9RHOB|nr:penicillin-insensitive murein endopeptidase [Rhodovulum bhavnagarense]TCP58704.1 murein endopeptidase [Rhodovulum bhavnagarense]
MGRILTASLVALALAGPTHAEPRAKDLFGAKRAASAQAPDPIGHYSRGCAAGLVQLPETGPTWAAMRLSRNRNWGHPDTIEFIKRLSAKATQVGWKGLYIGDISQPRGGPMVSGHASHQIGLDVDIWMLPPERLNLTRAERETLSSISVRSTDQRHVNGNFTPAHAAILTAAARDPAVDRIFVTPPVKIALCKTATTADTPWMQKIRPLYGHHYHFHVRLKCPRGARHCIDQEPTVAELSGGGNGCDKTLEWWVTDYLEPPAQSGRSKTPVPQKRHPRDFTMDDLPRECRAVLGAD